MTSTSKMYLVFILLTTFVLANTQGDEFDVIPSSKDIKKSQINYHREKLCMFKAGAEKCMEDKKIPGDPEAVASLVNIQKHQEFYENKKTRRRIFGR